MANIAPVRASEDHVQTEDRHASCKIVLVEDPLELHIQKIGTFLEADAARRVKTTSL